MAQGLEARNHKDYRRMSCLEALLARLQKTVKPVVSAHEKEFDDFHQLWLYFESNV